jgi:hypothetical protein
MQMQRLLKYLGSLFLLILISVGSVAWWCHTYEPEAKAFLEDSLREISSDWDGDRLVKRAAPELFNNGRVDQLRAMISALSPLGPLKSIESLGGTGFGYNWKSGQYIYANYATNAHFANGEATVRIGLVHRDGKWLITGFHINPMIDGHPQEQT